MKGGNTTDSLFLAEKLARRDQKRDTGVSNISYKVKGMTVPEWNINSIIHPVVKRAVAEQGATTGHEGANTGEGGMVQRLESAV
jgi:hypothetical protein